jgi:hypothetical protein
MYYLYTMYFLYHAFREPRVRHVSRLSEATPLLDESDPQCVMSLPFDPLRGAE